MKRIVLLSFITLYLNCGAQNLHNLQEVEQHIHTIEQDSAKLRKFYNQIRTSNLNKDSLILLMEMLYDVSKKNQFTTLFPNVARNLGSEFTNNGSYSKAISYLFIAEKYYKQEKEYNDLCGVYNVLGNAYLGLNQQEEQKKYFKLCYDLGLKHNFKNHQAFGAAGIANYYASLKNYKKSTDWNKKALVLFTEVNYPYAKIIISVNMATNYRMMNETAMAMNLLDSIHTEVEEVNFNYASYLFYKEKGDLYVKLNKFQPAIDNYLLALEAIQKDNAIHNLSEVYKSLSDVYSKRGKYEESLNYLNLHLQYKDSVFNEESSKQLIEVTSKYETEQKDDQIKILNQENALNKLELDRKKITIYAFIGGGILLGIMLIFFIKSNHQKNKTNRLLAEQKVIIEEKQKEILDSINYAKRIQFTLLASDNLLSMQLGDHFVYFEPKDIVSGDFYWGITKGTKSYLAVCDCTGHGVPGAFMSLLNINFLSEAITEKNIEEPGKIFDFVRTRLIENLSNDGGQDGMDGILLCIDSSTNEMTYAAANNAPICIQNGVLKTFDSDRMPVGMGVKNEAFRTFNLDAKKGDYVYLYTDGFADQFGGPKGKKFMHNQLKNELLAIHEMPFHDQRHHLKKKLLDWKGALEQVDDICIIGLKLS